MCRPRHKHDLRHTYASLLAAQGNRPEVVAKLMGHPNANITLQIYTHLWPEHLDDARGHPRRPTGAGRACVCPGQRDPIAAEAVSVMTLRRIRVAPPEAVVAPVRRATPRLPRTAAEAEPYLPKAVPGAATVGHAPLRFRWWLARALAW